MNPKHTVVKKNPTLFLRGNRSWHHNTELKTWKHLIGRHEQHELHFNQGVNSGGPEG